MKNLGAGGSTLRFGWFWTSVMIVQVALTVICIPPAGISQEALRDRGIRERFPAEQYLAARLELDQGSMRRPRHLPRAVSAPIANSSAASRKNPAFAPSPSAIACQG